MAEIKNEIVTNVLARCENADEATGAIGALVTTGVVSMNDVIKTMYNQYAEEVSSRNDEYEELVGENIELALKIAELENKLDEIRVEMIWNDDTHIKLKKLLEKLLQGVNNALQRQICPLSCVALSVGDTIVLQKNSPKNGINNIIENFPKKY